MELTSIFHTEELKAHLRGDLLIKWEVAVTFACEQAISCATEAEPHQKLAM